MKEKLFQHRAVICSDMFYLFDSHVDHLTNSGKFFGT
jgi:hypothetical protein